MIFKDDITQAAQRIAPYIHKTPVLTSQSINAIAGAELYFKCENFQKIGAFKMRGAANAVLSLTNEQKQKGVCTHSSGNFAQALALSAKKAGIKAYIVMPENAPLVKKEAVAGYGAEVILCTPTLEAREKTVEEVMRQFGATFIHPYNDEKVIAGHAGIVMEILSQVPSFQTGEAFLISPVGGGGLISGIALAAHYFSPMTIVVGAEPECAADAALSLKTGKIQPSLNPNTIADGLLTSLGDKTFPIIANYVKSIITVSETEIIAAMKLIWERMKIVVEPSSAVTLAAVLKDRARFENKRVGLVLSGGNVDLTKLPFASTKIFSIDH